MASSQSPPTAKVGIEPADRLERRPSDHVSGMRVERERAEDFGIDITASGRPPRPDEASVLPDDAPGVDDGARLVETIEQFDLCFDLLGAPSVVVPEYTEELRARSSQRDWNCRIFHGSARYGRSEPVGRRRIAPALRASRRLTCRSPPAPRYPDRSDREPSRWRQRRRRPDCTSESGRWLTISFCWFEL